MFAPAMAQMAQPLPLGAGAGAVQPGVQLAPPHMYQQVMQPAMSTVMPGMPGVMPGYMQQMALPQFAMQLVPQQDVAQPSASALPAALARSLAAAQPASTLPPTGALQSAAGPLPAAPKNGIDMNEVLQAVESLYRDQLRPYGRILRKRLAERAAEAGLGSADVDARRLQQACESCPWLYVQAEEGGDWSALLRGRPDCFVNVYSPEDVYPSELWLAADAYFAGLDEKTMALPGGRYSCAQVLVGRGLSFLEGRSLGQVCHIVQLAISQKKLLGYLNGAVVPYGRSQSMLKERCAERQRPCNSGSRGGNGLATWDMVRAFLHDSLSGLSGNDFVPLSNIKRMFRSKFRAELSETSLGHSKLSELLQDPRVADLCTVRLQKHGYAVFPLPRVAPANPISLASSLVPPCSQPATVAVAPAAPAKRRSAPAPLSIGEQEKEECEEMGELQVSIVEPGSRAPAGLLFPPTPEGETPCWLSRMAAYEQALPAGPLPHATTAGPLPTGPLPTLLGRRGSSAASEGGKEKGLESAAKAGAAVIEDRIKATRRPQPIDLAQEELDIWTMPLVTPNTMGHLRGSLEQNTFINMPEPLPTPTVGAKSRARSAER